MIKNLIIIFVTFILIGAKSTFAEIPRDANRVLIITFHGLGGNGRVIEKLTHSLFGTGLDKRNVTFEHLNAGDYFMDKNWLPPSAALYALTGSNAKKRSHAGSPSEPSIVVGNAHTIHEA